VRIFGSAVYVTLKSLLVSRLEIIQWLRHEIEEQKRIDMAKAGAPAVSGKYPSVSNKPPTSIVQSVLPSLDNKKPRKAGKHIISADRAFDTAEKIRKTFAKPEGMPTVVVDVPPNVYDAMIRSSAWLTEDEPWKGLLAMFPGPSAYPNQIREALLAKKEEGYPFVMLYASREHRMQLVQLVDLR
jgi:eukaryotic translation initiation factor 2-alpha kinase 4